MNHPQPTLTIDATGLSCPLPLLKAKQGLSGIASGEPLLLLASDPASERDVIAYTHLSQHALLEFACVDGIYSYLIQKG